MSPSVAVFCRTGGGRHGPKRLLKTDKRRCGGTVKAVIQVLDADEHYCLPIQTSVKKMDQLLVVET